MPTPVPHYASVMRSIRARLPAPRGVGNEVVAIDRATAQDFVERHHSTQPYINPRGLLATLGLTHDGRLAAVATVNTPTARFRREGCGFDGVIDLSRVASDSTVLGAASMLSSKVIDLLPVIERHGVKGCLFVTYSLIHQRGVVYAALVDKGLRPVELVKGQSPSGQRRKSSERALPRVQKIRWEAGPAAMQPNWSLLSGQMDPEKLAKLQRQFASFESRNRLRKNPREQSMDIDPREWTLGDIAELASTLRTVGLSSSELTEVFRVSKAQTARVMRSLELKGYVSLMVPRDKRMSARWVSESDARNPLAAARAVILGFKAARLGR